MNPMQTDPSIAAVAHVELYQSLGCEVYIDERSEDSAAGLPHPRLKINQI